MARKRTTILFKLLSSAGSGFYYLGEKSSKFNLRKLVCRKYDPIVNQHVLFQETKLPSGKKRT